VQYIAVNREMFDSVFVVFTLKGNQYIDMKTPDVDGPSRGFAIANPDYFNQGQQQQHAAATAPTEYLNIGRR